MSIKTAGISALKVVGKGISKATNLKPAQTLMQKFNINLEDAIAMATVGSIIAKDGIGCVMYVTQSLNNKKIPDEKRPFVAALDLTNGLLMILAQIGMFLAMRKYSGPLFNKLLNKSFNPLAKSHTITRMRMWTAAAGEKISKKLGLEKVFDEKVQKGALDVFKFIVDTAAATIIGKRVIVPLIATPFAKKVEKWLNKRAEAKSDSPAQEEDKSTPSMKGNEEITEKPVSTPEASTEEITNLLDIYKKNHKNA